MNNNQVQNDQVQNGQVQNNQMQNNQVTSDQVQKNIKENEKKGRGMFYGVVAVATFIIMAVGATFAYFTATTSGGSTSVQTGSTTLQLEYISYESAWMHADVSVLDPQDGETEIEIDKGLIPADPLVARYAFESQNDSTLGYNMLDNGDPLHGTLGQHDKNNNVLCKDDEGNSVCSVYVFQVRNKSNGEQTVTIELEPSENGFANLYAMFYQISAPTSGNDLTDYSDGAKYTYEVDSQNAEMYVATPITGRDTSNDPIFIDDQNIDDIIPTSRVKVVDGNGNTQSYGTYNPVYVNRKGVVKTMLEYTDSNSGNRVPSENIALGNEKVLLADNVTLPGKAGNSAYSEVTFAVVLYIKNLETNQTEDDGNGKTFSGRVLVDSGNGAGGGVSGSIGMMDSNSGSSEQSGG